MIAQLLCFTILLQFPHLPRRTVVPSPERVTTSLSLTVKTAAGEARTTVLPGQTPPDMRPLASIKIGEKPQFRWLVRNMDAHKVVSRVVVHFLVTRSDGPGKPIPPGLRQGTLMDSVQGTDIQPGEAASGDYNTPIYKAGSYQVEIELLNDQGNRLEYDAIDLEVKG